MANAQNLRCVVAVVRIDRENKLVGWLAPGLFRWLGQRLVIQRANGACQSMVHIQRALTGCLPAGVVHLAQRRPAGTHFAQSPRRQIDLLTDQVSRLQAAAEKSTERVVEQFQLAKAVPDHDSLPGSILQLRRFSQQSDVQLRVIRTSTVSTLGSLRVTEVELEVLGKFWDVDDFMFRVHRTVSVNSNDIPRVKGRLFAIKSAEVSLADQTESAVATDSVTGLLRVLVFSAPPAGAGAASAAVTATSGGIQ